MQVRIIINTGEALRDLRKKSQLETETVEDVETRYKFEAGQDKDEELFRCMQFADALLRTRLGRFLASDIDQSCAKNEYGIPENYVYDLIVGERRADGLAVRMVEMLHDYMVSTTLAKYYQTVGAVQLGQARAQSSNATGDLIQRELYTKKPPRP